MANNKVELSDGTTLMDITDTTAEPKDVALGETFYDKSGVKRTGTADYMFKVPNAEQNNVAIFDENGQVIDGGITIDDITGKIGDLDTLTTDDKTSLVNAINEVYEKSGEPFRVKQWASAWPDGVTIPVCTKEISNSQIPKMVFSIDAVEGADYQIVGMIAYEVFDAASGGNRLNVWPVCQFTGNGQKELSVRWMCGGTSDKVAKRINAWVLLKHR